VAPDRLLGSLLVALVIAGCGGKAGAADEGAVDLAALRAKRDSVRQVRQADSVARVRYASCSDSVLGAMAKTAAGKKKLAAAVPEGMIRPEVLDACGKPLPALGTPVTAQAAPDSTVPAPVATATPAAPAPDSSAGKQLTPRQLQVIRADSIRRAREDSTRQQSQLARADSVSRARTDSVRADSMGRAHETEVVRESFGYGGGPRDPFVSLISLQTVGPEFGDLQLVGIYQDLRRPGNSVAVLRDKSTSKRYKLRVGDEVGRLRVAQIRQRDIVFTVEDFGFERQETLSLRPREVETP